MPALFSSFHLSVWIAVLEIDLAVLEAEHGDHAVAVEELVVGVFRGELRVGMHAMERAVELGGDLALDLEVADVALKPHGPHDAGEAGIVGEMCHCAYSLI